MGFVVWLPDDGSPAPDCAGGVQVVWPPAGSVMPGWLCWASMAAPAKLLEWSDQIRHKETFIVLLELVALAAVYSSPVAQFLRGRDVLHFADNQSANCGAVKGRSSAPDLNEVIGELHPTWAELDVRPWVEYVRSEANVADLPSRGGGDSIGRALGTNAHRTRFSLPAPFGGWL